MRSEDQVNKRIFSRKFFHLFRLLHHTAAQPDHHMRIFLLLFLQHTQTPIYFQISIFPDSTGIVKDKIRTAFLRGLLKPHHFQHALQLLGIPGIHLTAQGGHKKGGTFLPAGKMFLQIRAHLFHIKFLPESFFLLRSSILLIFCQ